MTIKDLAMVQSTGIDIKVVEEGEDGKSIEKASFNSNYYGIITEEFLSQEIGSMTVRKTNGQSVYIEVATQGNSSDDNSEDNSDDNSDEPTPGTGEDDEP